MDMYSGANIMNAAEFMIYNGMTCTELREIKKRKFEAALYCESLWKVDMAFFKHLSSEDRFSRSRVASLNLESQSCRGDGMFVPSRLGNYAKAVGTYKGTLCLVKRGQKFGRIAFNKAHRKIFVSLKTIKEITHDNLNSFIGLSIDEEKYFYSLWAYCPRGSLDDVLFESEMRIDETFQVSLIRDIISGLSFLHDSPIGFHGQLYAKNCIVDTRWIAKITEYGMFDLFRELFEQNAVIPLSKPPLNILLCTAPEVLREEENIDYKLVDIYQFGIIAYKILYRKEPFDEQTITSSEVISLLKTLDFNGRPLRPLLKQVQGFDLKFLNLLETCWRENPKTRINAALLKKEIFVQTRKYGKNLIDHVMNMLEKYATNLEKIVEERTERMNEERRRADNLLYQILPKTIADALKVGRTIDPEIFETSTIYFSDIVGFTAICSKSLPTEIVAMLNSLYSQFDEIILAFDAYKVETIGDAYLVVSGVPVRNGMEHVTNIAEMSLNVLKVLKRYRVPHMPFTPVSVRIGLHSGTVAGGVVGVTMPRYCLFGDAVNFASRMESSGEGAYIFHYSLFFMKFIQ
uniref:Guanylate cyclase n=1 Tax=Romanomermis culicivorax TaxID=13658 RepID=A0A915JIV4_ROMCU